MSKEIKQSDVPKNLELLPNFILEVTIARVKFSEGSLKFINLFQGEISLTDCADHFEYVQGPAPLFYAQTRERTKAIKVSADVGRINCEATGNDRNLGVIRDQI